MKRALLIAEKPSVTTKIQNVYNKMRNEIPYIIDFSSAAGHLVGLCDPDEYREDWGSPWTADVLPIIPETWKKKITNQKFFQQIKKMWDSNRYDYVINAGDAGREGQLIQNLIYEELGVNVPILRFWADDTTDKTIAKTLKNLIPDENFKGLSDAAYLRLYFDWLVGINFSRAASLSLDRLSRLGRVMTAVLAMIVNREKSIASFVPVNYWEVEADFTYMTGDKYKGTLINPDSDSNYPSQYAFLKKEDLYFLQNIKTNRAIIEKIEAEEQIHNAPKLFNLSDLQKECSVRYKFSPSKTLKLAQSLYEKNFLSYPRTESKCLTVEQAKEIPGLLNSLKVIPDFTAFINDIFSRPDDFKKVLKSKLYIDNAKVSDHPALTPTSEIPDITALPEDERKVYMLVVKRFIAIFFPPEIKNLTTVITKLETMEDYRFKTVNTVVNQKGWKILYPEDEKDKQPYTLPKMKINAPSTLNRLSSAEKQTSPPKRYTDASILKAMETAGRQLDDKELEQVLMESAGLGTPATRADILDKLFDYNYIAKKGASIYPLQEGIELINALNGHNITSPEFTAQWEKKLKEVERGSLTYDKFYSFMIYYIQNETKALLQLEKIGPFIHYIGDCPICGKKFVKLKNMFSCMGYFDKNEDGSPSCSFALPLSYGGHLFSDDDIKILLAGEKTKRYDFTWKSGKTSRTSLILKDGKISFPEPEEIGTCPVCKGRILHGKTSYYCENAVKTDESGNKLCSFQVYGLIGKTEVTESMMSQLLKNGETQKEVKVKWPSGKSFSGKLVLNGTKIEIKAFEPTVLCKCKFCDNGTIMENKFNYACSCLPPAGTCELQIPKSYFKAAITRKNALDLIEGKSVKKKLSFKSGPKEKSFHLVHDQAKGYILKID